MQDLNALYTRYLSKPTTDHTEEAQPDDGWHRPPHRLAHILSAPSN